MTVLPSFEGKDRREAGALRILNLEDSPLDAELVQAHLTEGGISCELVRVQTRSDFAAALEEGGFDLILADYALPNFDGLSALEMVRKICPEVPFILISGALGEEVAIETLKRGAADYVLKQRLERLVPAVRRALHEAEERSARARAEEALRRSEQQFRTLVEQIPAATYTQQIAEPDSSKTSPTLYASPQVEAQSGYPPQAFVEDSELWIKLLHPEDRERVLAEYRRTDETGEPFRIEYRQIARDGRVVWVRDEAVLVRDAEGRPRFWQGVMFDITERKQMEEALRESEERFHALVQYGSDIVTILEANGTVRYQSPSIERVLGYRPEELVGENAFDNIHPEDIERALSSFAEVLSERGATVRAEFRSRHADGSWRYIEGIGKNLLDDPSVRGIMVTSRDVTERKEAEEALHRSEASLAEAQRMAHLGSWEWDLRTGEVLWSDEVFRIYGFELGEYVPSFEKLIEIVHPADRELLREKNEGALRRGEPYDFEHRIVRPGGQERVVHWQAKVVLDEEGEPLRMVGTVHDITERKRAEEALIESEQRFRQLFEQSVDALFVHDEQGRFVDCNAEACRALGYTREQLLALSVADVATRLLSEEDRKKRKGDTLWVRAVRGEPGRIVGFEENELRRKDGTTFPVEVGVGAIEYEGRRLIFASARDVTERKRAEEELRRSEERFRATFEQAAVGVAHVGLDGRWLRVNEKLCEIVGYRRPELLKKTFQVITHPDDLDADLGYTRQLLAGDIGTFSMEKRYFRKDGSVVWVNLTVSLVPDPTGDPKYFIAVIEDISARKQAEEALKQSEGVYRAVVEQAAESVFIVDLETRQILETNAALHRSLGYSAEEFEEMTLYDIVAHDRESIDRNVGRVLEHKRYSVGERKYRRKDGSLVTVQVNGSVVPYGGREALCVVAHDVTERQRAEQELRRSLSILLALREAGEVLGSTLESEEIITRLLEIMRSVADLSAAVISWGDEKGDMHVWRSVGLDALWPQVRFAPEAEGARRAVLEHQEQHFLRLRRPGSTDESLVALYLPLKIRDRVLGVLEAYGSESLAQSDTAEVLSSLTSQAASALENARLYEELAERGHELQDLVGKLLGAQEEERRRVAYEVHDGLAQVAAAAHQHLQAFAGRYSPDAEKGRRDMERILRLVRLTVSDARRIIANLRPTSLDDLGLAATLYLEIEHLREEGYEVDYREDLGSERLPSTVEITLFRVAQEALTNMHKHAQTRRVRIQLRHRKSQVLLRIRDYGRGFDPTAVLVGSGPGERVGLMGMRERVSILGGKLEVHSLPDVGTSIVATISLTHVP